MNMKKDKTLRFFLCGVLLLLFVLQPSVGYAGGGDSQLELLPESKVDGAAAVMASARIVTTKGWALAFDPVYTNPGPGLYLIKLFAKDGVSTFPDNSDSSAETVVYYLENSLVGLNTVKIIVEYTGEDEFEKQFAEHIFATELQFDYQKSNDVPPTVVSSSPADNATGVSINASPTLTFSEALDASTVKSGNIELREYADAAHDAAEVPATVVLSENDTVVTFQPASALRYDKKYYFYVDSGVKDKAGNKIKDTWLHADKDSHGFSTESAVIPHSSENTISSFILSGNDGVIALNSIAITVPSGTDVSALTPTIAFTGASISPASGAAQNFTNPVTYTVTAEDGSATIYTVIVNFAEVQTQATLTVEKNNFVGDLVVNPGTTNVRVASFILSAGSAEDVKIDSIKIKLSQVGIYYNLVLKLNTDPVSDNVFLSASDESVDVNLYNFVVPASSSEIIDVYSDMVPDKTGAVTLTVGYISAVGSSSLNPLESPSDVLCQTVTVINENDTQGGVSKQEYNALVALYNATGGDNWTNHIGWLDPNVPVSGWYGVTVENGKVTRLYLYNNELSGALPAEIGDLSNLESLDVLNNKILSFPAEVGNLTNLKTLFVDGNELQELPSEIGKLSNLESLFVGNNNILSLPIEIKNLNNLKTLDYSGNNLTNFPMEAIDIPNLEKLDVMFNKITSIPAEIAKLKGLKSLTVRYNKIESLPPEISELKNLTILDLMGNNLEKVPIEVLSMVNLEELDLGSNGISSVPVEIMGLANLKKLYFYGNNLQEFPTEILGLTNLESLNVAYNYNISSVPETINLLSNLKYLDVRGNSITVLPDSVLNLKKLNSLRVRDNKLDFSSLEKVINSKLLDEFDYSPQQNFSVEPDEVKLAIDDTLTLSVVVGGTANKYQWFKDGIAISEVSSDAKYVKGNITTEDFGKYICQVTNDIVTGLTLVSKHIEVEKDIINNFRVEANDYRVKLAWENLNAEGNDPIAYTIYRSTSTLSYPSWREKVDYVNQDNITEVQDFNLEPGVDYYYFVSAFDPNSSTGGETGWVGPVRISKKFISITSIKGGESFMGGTEHNLTFEIVDPSIVNSLNIFFTSNSNYGVGYIFCPDSLGGSCVWKVPEGYDYVSAQAQVNIAPDFKENIHTTSQYSDFRSEKFSIIPVLEQPNFLWTKPEVVNNLPTGGNVQITELDSKYDHYGVLHAATSYTMYGSRDGLENVEQISGISYSKREGGLWSAPERVYEFVTTTGFYYPFVVENLSVLIDSASKPQISWTLRNNFSGSNVDLDKQGFYYSTKENNEWNNEKISVSNGINEARIAMNNEDNAYLVWSSYEEPEKSGKFSLYYTKKTKDNSWSGVKNVFDSQIAFSNLFDLAITDNGNAHIIYSK